LNDAYNSHRFSSHGSCTRTIYSRVTIALAIRAEVNAACLSRGTVTSNTKCSKWDFIGQRRALSEIWKRTFNAATRHARRPHVIPDYLPSAYHSPQASLVIWWTPHHSTPFDRQKILP